MSTLTIQPSNIDTYLDSSHTNTNYGTATELNVKTSNEGDVIRSILKFDFSALPAGANISAATLSLYKYGGGADGRTYWVYEITQTAWTETGATWNKYNGTDAWATAGGDYTTTNGASTTVPADNKWMNWNVLSLVQHFQSTHGEIAHFLIRDNYETADPVSGVFYSNNYTTDLTLRPKLVVTYSTVTHYTLSAEPGSYSKTGQSAGLKAARKMAAAAGSYGLTGQAVALKAARKIAAGAGSYVLSGQIAALRAARRMAAAPDSYALTGQAADLKYVRKIAAGAGSYALTGQDVVLRAIRLMAAQGGSYVLTGQAANLVIGKHYILIAEAGSYGEPYSKIFVTLDGRIYKKMGNTYLRLS